MVGMKALGSAAKTVWKVELKWDVRWVVTRVLQLAVMSDTLLAAWRVGLLDIWMEWMKACRLAKRWVVRTVEQAEIVWAELWGQAQGAPMAVQRVRLTALVKVEQWVEHWVLCWGGMRVCLLVAPLASLSA